MRLPFPARRAAAPASSELRRAFEARLAAGHAALAAGDFDASLAQFEAAHILGQADTVRHVRSHVALFRWAWRRGDRGELRGQVGRLLGASLFTWLWVPAGNPGSTRVGAFSPHPVPPELATLLAASRAD